ncbi:3-phenylpropionate/cinnamic acid dioxygenase small subunit [Pseudacidovorax intermedius]|uniref:3-phenylpropionate/cinnamic acid dioxygenase small subunit n=1 Tax=Pseudacidovorax intermedius TaxID=433924 RepID=A0A370F1T1_9BURK|nr:nuclear transport factor 2 family protein [Pseudacidovorax intermedius]RDI16604.1 3-phenylpropionate/cinnamic acid dioxygenase small subunit [Pseudacidovorax intermedius]
MKERLAYTRSTILPRRAADLRAEIDSFHVEYCAALDANDIERWPEFFSKDASYRITSRQNALLGMPVGLIYCEGLDMITDRALAVAHSQMFAPRHILHVLGITRVLEETGDTISSQTPFILMQTLVEGPSTVHLAGIYHDRFVRDGERLLIASREVVHDTEILDTALAYPA